MSEPPPQRPRPPAARIILIAALCGATIGLLRVPSLVEGGGPGDFVARDPAHAAVDALYRISVWVPEAAVRSGYGDVLRPTPREETAVARYEILAMLPGADDAIAMHRLGIIYGERGYLDQAREMFERAAMTEAVDPEVCFALSLVYSDEPIRLDDAGRLSALLARQPEWWRLKTGERLAKRVGARRAAEFLDDEAHRELSRFALSCAVLLAVVGGLAVVGVGALLIMFGKYLFTREGLKGPWLDRLPRLGWLDLLDIAALVMCCSALGLAARGALGLGDAQTLPGAAMRIAHQALIAAPALGLIAYRLRGVRFGFANAIYLHATELPKQLLRGVIGAGVAVSAVLVALLLTAPGELAIPGLTAGGGLPGILDILTVVLFAPVVEEAIYRGYILQGLWQRWRPLPSAALSALLFAGAHLAVSPTAFGAIFALGFVSAYIFRWSRSLLACIILHSSYNAIVWAAMWIAKG